MLFQGVCTALVTPFDKHGVNYKAFGDLLDYQLSNGIDAVAVLGTTGEPATMTADEKRRTIKFVVDYVKGRIPVIAGAGTNSTSSSIANAEQAKELGADGLLVVTPYYNKCTQKGLALHYHAIADATDLPVIAYNVPGRTGVNILPATYNELMKHPNIVATKEACGNIEQISATAAIIEGAMDLYSGDDGILLPLLSLGAKGVISVAANAAPAQLKRITDCYFAGDMAGARAAQFAVNPFVKAVFCEVNPIPVKAALEHIGIQAGVPRLPLTEAEESTKTLLAAELTRLQVRR